MEIERKFLVKDDSWQSAVKSRRRIVQAYLAIGERAQVRVRSTGDQAWVTVKGQAAGVSREEFETEVPVDFVDGVRAAGLCEGEPVEKERHVVDVEGHLFEVDVFHGANEGLILAELELDAPDAEFPRPGWLGDEVTDDERYRNAYLAKSPYSGW
ncbi:CYTH domain-containing protein [Actinokineospora sp. HUAS TT18]|uniref:CYTH domain-containing protein n=1 Tax=Actinokineospora sp. HUAS TT18 TaxID=3447451 RepID=UPI003F527A47